MNSQTPTPDDGHPTEPLPERDTAHPTEPLPPASPSPQDQEPVRESSSGSTGEPGPGSTSAPGEDTSSGAYTGPYTGPSAGTYSAPNAGSYAYAGMPGRQADFFGWVRSQGISRGQDRWIGGVSSGIAHRMGIDPLIVRGVFIVLTLFAGIGVLLYGLAWAFLPEPDGRIHVQEAGAGRWTSGMTGSLIATILGFSGLGGGFWGWGNHGFGAFLWTIFWVGGAIYLIYYLVQRNKAAAGIPAGAAAAASGTNAYAAGSSTATTPPYSDVAGTGPFTGSPYGGTSSGTPSGSGYNGSGYSSGAYGGSGSGGSGWDNRRSGGALPPQSPTPKVRPAGPGAPAVAIIAGSALLVGAGLKALDVTNVINLGDSTNAIAWASAAAVLGLGILLMGLRGKTAGILSFFAVAALIVGGIFNVVGNNGDRMRFQELDWAPISIEDARNGLDVAGSRGTVDLTQLDTNAPLTSDVVVPLDIAASNVTIVIPDKVPVDIKADMAMGNIHESGGNRGGITTRESSYNSDEPGSHLIIEIDGAFSNVTIEEGN